MSTLLRPHPSPEADSSLSAGQKPWMPDRDQVIEIRGTSHRSATPDSSQRYRFRSSSPSRCVSYTREDEFPLERKSGPFSGPKIQKFKFRVESHRKEMETEANSRPNRPRERICCSALVSWIRFPLPSPFPHWNSTS